MDPKKQPMHFSRTTAKAERDLFSRSWVFLCVEWGHPLWDPIDTPLGNNSLANQNAGFQSDDNNNNNKTTTKKKQEDSGHFVVLCNTTLISISCLFILVRTLWYIYLDMWKHLWCGSLREGNFSRPLTTCYQKFFYEVDHLFFLIVLQGVQEYEKVANEVEQKTDSTISGKRSYYYFCWSVL